MKSKSTKASAATPIITLRELSDRWCQYLEEQGKASGTVRVYRLEFSKALKHFGEDSTVKDLTPERVAAFFASDDVIRTWDRRPKARLSIELTTRAFRLAVAWAAAEGLIKAAPLPADS